MVLLTMLVISLIATAISVAAFFMLGAVLAACAVLASYGALLALRFSEHPPWARAQAPAVAGDVVAPEGVEVHEVAADPPAESVVAERAEFRLAVAVAAPLVAGAVLLAGFLVGWRVAGLGALAFFVMMLLMGAPVWLAAVEDEIEEAEERENLPHPPSIR